LGCSAVERVRAAMEAQRHDLDAWTETAIGADYPNQKLPVSVCFGGPIIPGFRYRDRS
jgi:hypothetical protein